MISATAAERSKILSYVFTLDPSVYFGSQNKEISPGAEE